MKNIWIIAESLENVAVMTVGANELAADAPITVFFKGDVNAAQAAFQYGAAQVYALPLNEKSMWEDDYLSVLVEKAKAEGPDFIMAATSKRCRALAARMAALLDVPCLSDAKNLILQGTAVCAEMMVYGGLAVKTVTVEAPIVMATVSNQAYEPRAAGSATGQATLLEARTGGNLVIERQPRKAQSNNLASAPLVVGFGRGVSEQSEVGIVENLAKAMQAEIACSRPIAEFYKWLPEEAYIGISGQIIKPQLYLAVGISGQAQHYYGVRDAKVIVSINKDPDALMNSSADYYIVGDFKEILPALEAAFA